jgi:hypothetical protein
VREGIVLTVGQSANLALQLKVLDAAGRGRGPGRLARDRDDARRVLDAHQLGLDPGPAQQRPETSSTSRSSRPGVSIVQGPDGDELTINGQKGIYNNVSVDGADFNNPFFGEQRGGQRPAFTFNLDAVQEVVVVASGANAEFGRSNGGFVNVVTKSGTNQIHGTLHAYFKDDSLSSAPKKADGSEADKFPFSQQQYGFTLGGPIVKDKAFYFVALDYQNGDSTKQTDPSRIEQRVVDYFAALGSPGRERLDRAHQRRARVPRQDRLAAEPQAPRHDPLQLHLGRAEERHLRRRLVGRERERVEKDDSHAVTGSLISNLSSLAAQRVPLPVGAREPAAALRRAEHHGPEPPAARHRVRLRPRLPLRRAVLHPGRLLRRAHPVQRQHLGDQGPPLDEVRSRVQPGALEPDVPRLPERPLHLRLDRRLPELRAQPEVRRVLERRHLGDRRLPGRQPTSPARCSVPPAVRRRLGSRPRRPARRTSRRPSSRFFAQDKWQPNRSLTVSYGCAGRCSSRPT